MYTLNFKKEYHFYIIILLAIAVGILCFILIKKIPQPLITYQPRFKPMEEKLKPGTIGETENPPVSELPPAMFSTTATIKEVTGMGLKVQGSGSNFNDQQARILTIVFINSTLTVKLGEKIRYQGLEGLKYLKAGMEVLIEGEENIRGKVQFQARYITIL